jgi:hypothetical protein
MPREFSDDECRCERCTKPEPKPEPLTEREVAAIADAVLKLCKRDIALGPRDGASWWC